MPQPFFSLPLSLLLTALLALSIDALPSFSASSSSLLLTRFQQPYTQSRCLFDPRFLGYHTKALVSRPAKAEVTITDKSTQEKGELGSGLHDNLIGECGRDQITGWQTPAVLGTNVRGTVMAYSVWFGVGGTQDPGCIQRAIKIAENQDVVCQPFW